MRSLVLLVLAASVALVAADKPWFCHDEECPPFEVIDSNDDYETRKYAPAKWVQIIIEGSGYNVATTKGFASLYKYFDGDNVNSTKIPMTTPTVTQVHTDAGKFEKNFTIAFYLPKVHQASPPLPTEKSGVYIEEVEEFTAYVVQYGGFSSESIIAEKAATLHKVLQDEGIQTSTKTYFAATYDPPYRITKRHNEVLLLDTKSESESNIQARVEEIIKAVLKKHIPFSRTSVSDVVRQVV